MKDQAITMVWKDAHFKHTLALLSIVGIFILIGILEFKPLPENNRDVVNLCIGALIGGLITRIAGSYFPSSGGDKINATTDSLTIETNKNTNPPV